MHVCSIVCASDLHFWTIKQEEIQGVVVFSCIKGYAAGDAASQAYLMIL